MRCSFRVGWDLRSGPGGDPSWTSGREGVLPSLTELMDSRSQVRGTTIIIMIVISIRIISVIVIVFVIAI